MWNIPLQLLYRILGEIGGFTPPLRIVSIYCFFVKCAYVYIVYNSSSMKDEQVKTIYGRLNWLRAAVLGANDGIISTAGLVVGVAGATTDRGAIFTAGMAGILAGALSMAGGEYVSVSSQRDSEETIMRLSRSAKRRAVFGINLVNPLEAAIASAVSFTVGAIIPFVVILMPFASWRVPATMTAVTVALAITGALSARAGGASKRRAVKRVVISGLIVMGVTFVLGSLFGS